MGTLGAREMLLAQNPAMRNTGHIALVAAKFVLIWLSVNVCTSLLCWLHWYTVQLCKLASSIRALVAAHLFPVHFQAVALACTLASLVRLYWHDLILWPQSDHRRRCQSEFAAQLSLSVWLLGDIHVRGKWQKSRAQRAIQYGTEAASSCLAGDLWPLLGRQICTGMWHCGQRCSIRLHVLYAPGSLVTHWLAWPAHIHTYIMHWREFFTYASNQKF